MGLSEKAKEALRRGSIKLRVNRSGMFQQLTFKVKTTKFGNLEYSELYSDRLIELSELAAIADEVGLPVEAPNGRAFPKGTRASDFQTGQAI